MPFPERFTPMHYSLSSRKSFWRFLLALRQGKALFAPASNAAIHRNYVGVPHLLKIVCRQRRAKAAAAVENHLGVEFGRTAFNVTLDHAFTQMNRARQVILGELAFFAHIYEQKFIAAVHARFDLVDVG